MRENEEEKSQGGKRSGKQKGEERFSCTTLVVLDSSIPKMEDSKTSDELENHFCPNTMDPSFLEDNQSLAFLETSLTMIILRCNDVKHFLMLVTETPDHIEAKFL